MGDFSDGDRAPGEGDAGTHWHGWHLNCAGIAVKTTETEYSLSEARRSSYDSELSLITPSFDCAASVAQ